MWKKNCNHLVFENYKTDTHIDISNFWSLFWKTLRYRPTELCSIAFNSVKIKFYRLRFRKILLGKQNFFVGKFIIDMLEQEDTGSRISFGNHNLIRYEQHKNHFRLLHKGQIEIGNNNFLNGVFMYCYKKIKIGNNVMIGWGTELIDTDAHPIDKTHALKSKEIVIEDDVWISNNVTVLKGVKIGKGSVIGARSVVISDVKPHSLYAGNPARFIKKIGPR